MGYDDIRLYRPGKICGCLCVEVVLKWEHDQECSRGALVRKGRLGDADKTVVIDLAHAGQLAPFSITFNTYRQ